SGRRARGDLGSHRRGRIFWSSGFPDRGTHASLSTKWMESGARVTRARGARGVLLRGQRVSSAGVLFARPLVGSRWTAAQGPLAQKTPTLLNLPFRATRRSALILIAVLLFSCAAPVASSPSPRVTTIPIPTTASPPTSSPTATASPRIGPAVVEHVQLVAPGLRAPWAVHLAPDGTLFGTHRPGPHRTVQLGP